MWYSSANEPPQPVPSTDSKAEPQSAFLFDEQAVPAAHLEKTDPVTTPGSEYWLP